MGDAGDAVGLMDGATRLGVGADAVDEVIHMAFGAVSQGEALRRDDHAAQGIGTVLDGSASGINPTVGAFDAQATSVL